MSEGGNFEGVEEDDTYEDEGNEDQLLPGEQIGYPFKPYTSLRKGKWTAEEEMYTNKVIETFNLGILKLAGHEKGITLRAYLANKLGCDPMRITKKYTGNACIGKRGRVYHAETTVLNEEDVMRAQEELEILEYNFRQKLEQSVRKKKSDSTNSFSQSISTPAIDALIQQGKSLSWSNLLQSDPDTNYANLMPSRGLERGMYAMQHSLQQGPDSSGTALAASMMPQMLGLNGGAGAGASADGSSSSVSSSGPSGSGGLGGSNERDNSNIFYQIPPGDQKRMEFQTTYADNYSPSDPLRDLFNYHSNNPPGPDVDRTRTDSFNESTTVEEEEEYFGQGASFSARHGEAAQHSNQELKQEASTKDSSSSSSSSSSVTRSSSSGSSSSSNSEHTIQLDDETMKKKIKLSESDQNIAASSLLGFFSHLQKVSSHEDLVDFFEGVQKTVSSSISKSISPSVSTNNLPGLKLSGSDKNLKRSASNLNNITPQDTQVSNSGSGSTSSSGSGSINSNSKQQSHSTTSTGIDDGLGRTGSCPHFF